MKLNGRAKKPETKLGRWSEGIKLLSGVEKGGGGELGRKIFQGEPG